MIWSLRFLQLLSMVLWVGGLAFFAFALAPVAFYVLPVREAGLVVGGVLRVFHTVALGCGVVFLIAGSLLLPSSVKRAKRNLATQLLFATAMCVVTLCLQTLVLPAMDKDRNLAGGDINAAAPDTPARLDFDRLHVLSERLESLVLLGGVVVIGLLARRPSTTA